MTTKTLTFIADTAGQLYYEASITGMPQPQAQLIGTNVDVLTEQDMRMRLLCDLLKDGVATTPSLETAKFKTMLKKIYCQGQIVKEQKTILSDEQLDAFMKGDFHKLLKELDDKLTSYPTIAGQTTSYINQPKLSTVGSNIKISTATHVFWESGFGSKSICQASSFNNILTPAAIMDPLDKEKDAKDFFPEWGSNSVDIVFHKSFTKRLGFPDTLWACIDDTQGAKQVDIQYTQVLGQEEDILSHLFTENTTKEEVKDEKGEFGNYIKGNYEKNIELEKKEHLISEAQAVLSAQEAEARMEVIRILETKELGDVAQVWLYLAYIIVKGIKPEDALMITTDSVVYLFCRLLNLSCAYTGSRAGVSSKNCSIYHYLVGTPNYQLKITSMMTNAFDIMAQKIASQKYILALVAADITLSKFYYMRMNNGKLRKTHGFINETTVKDPLSADRNKKTIQYFQIHLIQLEIKAKELADTKTAFDTTLVLHTDDTQVMDTYKKFTASISKFECPLYFTKLSAQTFLLHDKFRDELYPHWNTDHAGGSSIGEFNYMTSETSSSKFLSEEKIYVGGEIGNKEEGITFLEAVILTATYLELLTGNFISKNIEEEFEPDEIALFAITYDKYAYNINNKTYEDMYTFIINKSLFVNDASKVVARVQDDSIQEGEEDDSMQEGGEDDSMQEGEEDDSIQISTTGVVAVDGGHNIILTDENIMVVGVVLSDYLYFAHNFDGKLLLRQTLEWERATRSSNFPIFIPDTACDGTQDSFTRIIIPTGTGIAIFDACYSINTLVQMLVAYCESNKGCSFTNLFQYLFINLFNYSSQNINIPKYYKLTFDVAITRNPQEQIDLFTALCNIFAFMYTYYNDLYIYLRDIIPDDGLFMFGHIKKDTDGLIKFAYPAKPHNFIFRLHGGSNKYLFKRIKSKKNRLKKIKSKKNRLKKIKSKQHRLKKIKSKKFTRKNKKSKDGVI